MDEPLSNLDAKLRIEMHTELKRLHLETLSTFVYVTHDQLEAMSLSLQVCLMKEGIVQQYAPPLSVYNNPANLFCAEFVGNPTMNFIHVVCTSVHEDTIELSATNLNITLTPGSMNQQASAIEKGHALVLGLRPECISPAEDSPVRGTVYSALPSGMETTVIVKLRETYMTLVVFGGQDFPVDTEIGLEFNHHTCILFDDRGGKRLSSWAVSVQAGDSA